MNSKRVYYILLGLIGVLFISLLGSAYGVNVLLHSKSKHLLDLKLQSQVLSRQQVGLTKAKKEVQTYSGLNTIAKSIVPQDKDQAEAVREISNLAQQSGISQLSSISFPASTLGGIAGGTGSVSATPSAASKAGSNLTQLTPVKGIAGLYGLQITINQSSDSPISYSKFISFLAKLEQNRRTSQVISISLTPDSKTPSLVGFTLIINEFIRP